MIKVLHFIHGLNMGGAETLVKDYALGLDKEKFDVTVLCYEHYDSPYEILLRKAGIKVIYVCDSCKHVFKNNLVNKIYSFMNRIMLIRKYIREIRPDVLHTHMQVNCYIRFSKPKKPIHIFHTVHNDPQKLWFTGSLKDKRDLQAAKWLVKRYNMRFITLHSKMCEEINRLFNVNNSIILNNGIELKKFYYEGDRENLRRKLKIPIDAFVIGHVGRFSEQKNHKFLVSVFEKIHSIDPKAFLLMIGMGDQQQNIEMYLNKLGLQNNYMILSNRTDIPPPSEPLLML